MKERDRVMLYRCKNSFKVEMVDDDYAGTDKYRIIKKGSKWEENGHKIVLDGFGLDGVHLDEVNGSFWIEISKKRLEEFFEEIKTNEKY